MSSKNTSFTKRKIDCNGLVLDFSTPLIMGILNLTPDSFYDGGRYQTESKIIQRVEQMLEEGAKIIDLGAISTRPGSKGISLEEEMERLLKPLQWLKKHFPNAIISVDTYRSQIARECVENGAHIINDISGGSFDNEMFATIADLNVPYVLMHIKGNPRHMQNDPIAKDVVAEVRTFFETSVRKLQTLGVKDIILDPGFGFGKTLECNYALLNELEKLRIAGLPLLAGVSRKSMINKVLGFQAEEALNGSTVLHAMALLNGAQVLRVHDVKEAAEAIRIVEYAKSVGKCE